MGITNRKTCVCSFLVVLLAMPSTTVAAAERSADGCQRNCGGMEIPYPFGLFNDRGSCYRNDYFGLTCNHSYNPPKLFTGDVEVTSISLPAAKMVTLLGISYDCGGANFSFWNITLADIFTISYTENVFTGVGCDTMAQIEGPDKDLSFTGGCLSDCSNSSVILDGECSGIGCCQAAVPSGLQRYSTNLGSDHSQSSAISINPCSYSFVVQKGNYSFRKSDLARMDRERSFPVVFDWSIIDADSCEEAVKNKTSYACISTNSLCLNSSEGPTGYICNCSNGFSGNPYILEGCQDIDECKDPLTYPCNGICTNLPGSYNCTCPYGTTGDPKSGCQQLPRTKSVFRTAIVIPVVAASSLLIICLSIWVYSMLQKRKVNKMREKCFLQNGGKLLRRRISTTTSNEDVFKIFSREEIEKATNKYDQAYVLGRGGQGVVYKGTLPNDSRTFAIKKSVMMDGSKIEEFINELVILSKVNHRNIVKLVGCCLEVEDPLLVYEFVDNGTLSEHIKHGSLPWDIRLKIAVESAGALGYLHSSTNTPIIHRDVKSSNILLDKHYAAKVSDFGASKLIPIEETQVQTVVMGTLGYLDPEYMLTHQLTEKSDVYSFGVVLVELLTGKAPISYEKTNAERCLATHFISYMKDGKLEDILDPKVLNLEVVSQMREVSMLAQRCLSMLGEDRPRMIEVAMELEGLRRNKNHPWVSPTAGETQALLNETDTTNHTVEITMSNDETHLFNSGVHVNPFHIDNGR